jgi:hypothetical protein
MTFGTLLLACCAPSGPVEDPPIELGAVRWRTDHDQAFEDARRSGKPLVLFFQEVPG